MAVLSPLSQPPPRHSASSPAELPPLQCRESPQGQPNNEMPAWKFTASTKACERNSSLIARAVTDLKQSRRS
jgi:hypothetical protein